MERPIDPEDLETLLTQRERDSLAISQLPRAVRGAVDKAIGSTKQSRWNARKRAAAKLAKSTTPPYPAA